VSKVLTALYSVACYLFFLVTFVYAIGFVEGLVVPKTIDSGPVDGLALTLAIDVALLGVFAVQHSVMARPGFKRMWTKIVPPAAERSTYVLFATLALALLVWQWRPLPQTVWQVQNDSLAAGLVVVSFAGWGLLLLSTFLLNHFHLFGLVQGFSPLVGHGETEARFETPLFYKWIRHPLYTGFIIAFWAAPVMSVGHLVFAAATTGYIFVGIWFEERDLIATFGDRYRRYQAEVGMILPRLKARAASKAPQG
jgi:protein-S-isoprenylcysteine O-methyltransferase Ste14